MGRGGVFVLFYLVVVGRFFLPIFMSKSFLLYFFICFYYYFYYYFFFLIYPPIPLYCAQIPHDPNQLSAFTVFLVTSRMCNITCLGAPDAEMRPWYDRDKISLTNCNRSENSRALIVRPRHGHISIRPRHGHISMRPRHGHISIRPRHGHISIRPRHGHISIRPRHGHIASSLLS